MLFWEIFLPIFWIVILAVVVWVGSYLKEWYDE